MKKLVVESPDSCIGCESCATACSKAYYKVEDATLSAIRIETTNDGSISIRICDQCGKCAAVCPVEAISQNAQGVYVIDRKVCVGCLACMDACPSNVIVKSHDNLFATKCTACGLCVKACPQDVLAL